MKVIPIALLPQYTGGSSTLCTCLWVRRADGQTILATGADIDVVIAGQTLSSGEVLDGTYAAAYGLDISAIASSALPSVDNLVLTVIPEDGDDQLVIDLQTGKFDNARFVIFECNYLSPSDGINVLRRGSTGDVTINRGVFSVEFRSLKQALQHPVGAALSKTCRYTLGLNNGFNSLCPVNLAAHTESVAVTAVSSRQVFTIASAQPNDWSGEGYVEFTSGDNAGYRYKVKTFASGVVTLTLPAHFTVGIGDALNHVAGCRKRHDEDCIAKFDAGVDFGGEPHATGIDHLTASPETDV